jgi:excisionase family DNA binding protein
MKTMTDLIHIQQKDGIETVNARELHQVLKVGKDYSTWIKDRIEKYDFIEGEDYSPELGKSSGGRPAIEYYITFDMAKELSMLENNAMGKKARRWFIQKQKELAAIRGYHLMTSREVARMYRVSIDTIQKYSRLGELPFIMMGNRRMYRYEDVIDYLYRNYVPAKTDEQGRLPFEVMANTVAYPVR